VYDLGDTVTIARTCRDAAGAAANATTVVLTVTLPDGTTATPAVANPPGTTGQYTVGYVPTQVGRYAWRMTFTGVVPDQAHSDVFHVWPAVNTWIVGLAEVKDTLNIDQANTSQDEELRRTIAGATAVVEDIVGVVARRSFTQTFSGRGTSTLLLSRRPVIPPMTTVVEDGVTLAASDYTVTEHGVLTRLAGGTRWRWPVGVDNIVATHNGGRAIVGDNILDGTRDLIRVNFRPQIGGNRSPFDNATDRAEPGQMRLGFFVPNSVMERLHGSARGPHVA
jgi:hypothetical protein